MKKKGYTVAELIFALIILSIFMILNISLYVNALKNVKKAERLADAINIAINKIEEIHLIEYNDVNEDTYSYEGNDLYTVNVTVTEDTTRKINNNNVFKEVTVTVLYKIAGIEYKIELTCLKVNNNVIEEIYGNIII